MEMILSSSSSVVRTMLSFLCVFGDQWPLYFATSFSGDPSAQKLLALGNFSANMRFLASFSFLWRVRYLATPCSHFGVAAILSTFLRANSVHQLEGLTVGIVGLIIGRLVAISWHALCDFPAWHLHCCIVERCFGYTSRVRIFRKRREDT
jgi:hypothetical protein